MAICGNDLDILVSSENFKENFLGIEQSNFRNIFSNQFCDKIRDIFLNKKDIDFIEFVSDDEYHVRATFLADYCYISLEKTISVPKNFKKSYKEHIGNVVTKNLPRHLDILSSVLENSYSKALTTEYFDVCRLKVYFDMLEIVYGKAKTDIFNVCITDFIEDFVKLSNLSNISVEYKEKIHADISIHEFYIFLGMCLLNSKENMNTKLSIHHNFGKVHIFIKNIDNIEIVDEESFRPQGGIMRDIKLLSLSLAKQVVENLDGLLLVSPNENGECNLNISFVSNSKKEIASENDLKPNYLQHILNSFK